MSFAGLWKRFAAAFIDCIVIAVGSYIAEDSSYLPVDYPQLS